VQVAVTLTIVANASSHVVLNLQGVLADVELLQDMTMASRAAVGAFVEDRTDKDGRVSSNAIKNFARFANFDREPYMKALEVRPLSTGVSSDK